MNTDIPNTVRQYVTCLKPQEKMILFELPCKLWEVVSAEIFMIKNKTLMYNVDHYSEFPIKVGSLAVDDLVQMAEMVFAEYGLPEKDHFRCRHKLHTRDVLAIFQLDEHTAVHYIILLPPEQGQVEVCIKVVKHMIKNALMLIGISVQLYSRYH